VQYTTNPIAHCVVGVSSALQTTAGRLIFAELKDGAAS